MLDSTLEDTFGNRYSIRQTRQNTWQGSLQPLRFTDVNHAFAFVNRLRPPHGYWLRTVHALEKNALSSTRPRSRTAQSCPEHQVSEYLYRERLFVYELVDDSSSGNDIQKRSFEQSNGDRYTFSHVSALLGAATLQPVDLHTKAAAEEMLGKLASDEQQLDELADELNLSSPEEVGGGSSGEKIIAAIMAGEVIVSIKPKLSSPPEPEVLLDATAADRPADMVSSMAETVAEGVESSKADLKSQMGTLEKAAKEGIPFCEECEKARAAQAQAS
ncbi:hypothetical protein MNBD_GAMMA11-2603 [hydrothermal vent metagenome]|uniref:Uncharacterized protein n=1 Tax=hydrothermal vent metagenome TaxID=652676 RepID=A0A3B0X2X1_9ZZZZ